MPSPSSRTEIRSSPPAPRQTSTWRAPASSAFSTSSFTTEAGRSITSPAAICPCTAGGRTAILPTWLLGGCPGNHGGCGERSGGCELRARPSLLWRAFRHALLVVAALVALVPRLVRLLHHDCQDRLLEDEAPGFARKPWLSL